MRAILEAAKYGLVAKSDVRPVDVSGIQGYTDDVRQVVRDGKVNPRVEIVASYGRFGRENHEGFAVCKNICVICFLNIYIFESMYSIEKNSNVILVCFIAAMVIVSRNQQRALVIVSFDLCVTCAMFWSLLY